MIAITKVLDICKISVLFKFHSVAFRVIKIGEIKET